VAKKLDPKKAEKFMLKAGLKPLEPFVGVDAKWTCVHIACGGVVTPSYSNVKYGFGPCKPCGIKSRALKKTIPEKLAVKFMVKNGVKPIEPYKSARSSWKCKCMKCGKIVYPTYNKIQQGRGGCKDCGVKVGAIKRKTPEKQAVKEMLKAKLKPLEPYVSSNQIWKCECLRCGRVVTPTHSSVHQGNGGCGYCAGNLVNPLAAEKLMISKGYRPQVPYLNSHTNWECIHLSCGNIVSPQFAQIQQGYGGCRHCAEWGFQYDKKSYLYLITHPQYNSHKIGIANNSFIKKNDRLRRHQRHGWLQFKVWKFEEGRTVEQIEKEVLRILRKDLHIPQFLSREEMPYMGETETMSADSITLFELEKIINRVIKERTR
jgi:Fe-S cluster biogenesis protein NfuA